MRNIYSYYQSVFSRSRGWIRVVGIFAVVSIAAGFLSAVLFPERFSEFVSAFGERLDEALNYVEPAPTWQFSFELFRQNFTATLLDLLGGVVLGIIPVVSIVINFFALGFLGAPFVYPDVFGGESLSLWVFIVAIAPHGIFELPAIILSSAMGLRFGWEWLLPRSRGRRKATFKQAFLDVLGMIPLTAVLLVAAALLEAFVTSRLVS